ncbi:MAG TPA: hypothetical protein VFG76_03855, partial [Candidatus Polarisedimenticolia bacterium]|nr:hypothetical protein [Candidatus Polarisedimenticolia bacterium]
MRARFKHATIGVAAVALALAASDARSQTTSTSQRLVLSTDGATAWTLLADGRLVGVEIATGRSVSWEPAGSAVSRFTDIGLLRDGRTLVALLPDSEGRFTDLVSYDVPSRA